MKNDADTPPPVVRAADSRRVAELRALAEAATPCRCGREHPAVQPALWAAPGYLGIRADVMVALLDKLAAWERVGRVLEWGHTVCVNEGQRQWVELDYCPACGARKLADHYADCALAALLGAEGD